MNRKRVCEWGGRAGVEGERESRQVGIGLVHGAPQALTQTRIRFNVSFYGPVFRYPPSAPLSPPVGGTHCLSGRHGLTANVRSWGDARRFPGALGHGLGHDLVTTGAHTKPVGSHAAPTSGDALEGGEGAPPPPQGHPAYARPLRP